MIELYNKVTSTLKQLEVDGSYIRCLKWENVEMRPAVVQHRSIPRIWVFIVIQVLFSSAFFCPPCSRRTESNMSLNNENTLTSTEADSDEDADDGPMKAQRQERQISVITRKHGTGSTKRGTLQGINEVGGNGLARWQTTSGSYTWRGKWRRTTSHSFWAVVEMEEEKPPAGNTRVCWVWFFPPFFCRRSSATCLPRSPRIASHGADRAAPRYRNVPMPVSVCGASWRTASAGIWARFLCRYVF